MKSLNFLLLISVFLLLLSCGAPKSTLKNVDDSAASPVLKNNAFVLTEVSTDKKYGYDEDYPINIFYRSTLNDTINQGRFLKALAGPNGEAIRYKKLESCCPFPTKKSPNGAGFLDVYEITWDGCKKPLLLYFNIYERGKLMVPKGLTARKDE